MSSKPSGGGLRFFAVRIAGMLSVCSEIQYVVMWIWRSEVVICKDM